MQGINESPAPVATGNGADEDCSGGEPNSPEFNLAEGGVQVYPPTDSRFSFLCAAHSHYRLVYERAEDLGYAFNCVTRLFDRLFPPSLACCEVCGLSPCGNPPFCKACREADQRPRRVPAKIVDAPRTPQTVVEAIMFCVRERGVRALKEPKVWAWLEGCDADAKRQLKSKIKKLQGIDANDLRRTA